ncbi:galactose oxidase [Rhizopus microsporus ATCC 52813]|uniref:Galactose oxidase n=1 Tax=Rhizopus microsporus ATCC 52813 TaxID=1340429 RepID=A0A2G4TA19_RHIZD|nr:galactose oxidase [Rhizopus microsporus ATCC 52813]PHZ17864.1 galactose oxidase [Rhizopus microsporus ATCC 52813]
MSKLPFKGGMATAQRNSSLLLFGGENSTTRFTNTFYSLTQTTTSFTWNTLPQKNPPPGVVYAQAVMANNNNFYLLGGLTESANNQSTLPYYSYSFDTQTWTAAPSNTANNGTNSTLPGNRYFHSVAYDGQNSIYIYGGGSANGTGVFSDLYKLDITTGQFTLLQDSTIRRYGHTASYLSNGLIVILGGVYVNPQGKTELVLMNQVTVYNTKTNAWSMQPVKSAGSSFPSARANHNAVVSDNGEMERNKMYLNAIAILDTSSWTWSVPNVSGIPPSRRSYASAGILDGKHLTVAFGEALNTYINDINVWEIDSGAWLQNFQAQTVPGSSVSAGLIAGVTVACVVVVIILLFLLWKFQSYVRWLIKRIHRDIWKPRTGEPLWAETTRIIFQIILLFIFAVFLAFVIRQAVDSPNVTQTIEEATATVEIPDVRFCFDGFPTSYSPATDPVRALGVACSTNSGYSCNQYIQPLDMSIFQPMFADSLGAVVCYLFKPSSDFVLTSTAGNNNGTRLLFTFFGDPAATYARIHVSVYPQKMDPNLIVYGLPNEVIMSPADIENWRVTELNDLQAENVYEIQPFTYNSLTYTLIDHRYLQPKGWNYVGFLPITNSTPEIDTIFRAEAPNPVYNLTHGDLGVLSVIPSKYVRTIEREVKVYTLVNAIGFVGGIFGLLVAIQTWLFGFRPRSPWGVVHRWSVGEMKRSLLRGLQSKFRITNSGIPLVHPVHHRFSMTDITQIDESESQRIARVEERMQMLEMLFKAYYVDDEVFRSLDDANRVKQLNNMSQNNNSSPRNMNSRFPSNFSENPRTEKVDDAFMSPKPASFSRQDTDASSASHIPLTQRNYHAPSYQPNTTVQMHEEDEL